MLRLWYVGQGLAGFGRPDVALARRSIGFGMKAHGARVLGWGNYRIDQLFVGTIAGSSELGLYSYAVTWAETLFYLPQTLVTVQRPDLVRATRDAAAKLAATVYRVAVLLSAAVRDRPRRPGAVPLHDPRRGRLSRLDRRPPRPRARHVRRARPPAARQRAHRAATPAARNDRDGRRLRRDGRARPPADPEPRRPGAAIASTLAYTAGGVAAAYLFSRTLGGRFRDLLPRGDEFAWLRAKALPFSR